MDKELYKKIYDCFGWLGGDRYGNPQDAYTIVEENLKDIDFDDEDDAEKIIEVVLKALNYSDGHGIARPEEGVKFLEFLISKGFDVNFKLVKKECLILKLAEHDVLPEVFQKIVDLGADVYSETTYGSNVLTVSAKAVFKNFFKPDMEKSERLPIYIVEHFDLSVLDHPDQYGATPLMYAVMKNKTNLLDALLNHGSDVNASGGQTAGGYSYWIKLYGVTPLALAFRDANKEMAKKLLDAGADDTACDAEGAPALFSLLYHDFEYDSMNVPQKDRINRDKGEIVALLKNPDFADSAGNTLLMKSLVFYDYSRDKKTSPFSNGYVMSALLARGADVNLANNEGKRALHFAAQSWSGLLKDLLSAGADINAQDNNGNTALMILCMNRDDKSARMFLRKGADFNIKNKEGKSAMDIAAEKGLTDVLELMV